MQTNNMIFRCSPISNQDGDVKVISPGKTIDVLNQPYSQYWIKGDYDSLPEVPLMYPIERTNAIVECTDPRLIADRILRCLQKLSITAAFNSSDVS